MPDPSSDLLLDVRELSVVFGPAENPQTVVHEVSFDIKPAETLALVGESGSGKSVSALSILRLLPQARHPSGQILFRGRDILSMAEPELRAARGDRIAVVFQEPMTAMNPLHNIERQIGEALTLHQKLAPAQVRERTIELLSLVGIPEPETRLGAYVHQLSGGQRQRVMIAMALANEPDLLIADEPTTALDVTVQAQVLDLLMDLQRRMGMAILLITHDLRMVRRVADRVVVMRQGRVVERGETAAIFARPREDYTRLLLKGGDDSGPAPTPADAGEILRAENLKVHFPIKRGLLRRTVDHFKAVDGVSLSLKAGHSLGLVGESGSGKTTLALALLRLIHSQGPVAFMGQRIDGLDRKALRPLRRRMQIVFQDPFGSLSPRMTILQIIAEGLAIHGLGDAAEREEQVVRVMEEVGLEPEARHRYPHEFSGGQRQRVAIARALVLKPALMVLDEPTSALDRAVQFQVVSLLRSLQQSHGLAYLFIAHDLKVVQSLCHDLVVLKDGQAVEAGPAEELFANPRHPYTRMLFAAAFDQDLPGSRLENQE